MAWGPRATALVPALPGYGPFTLRAVEALPRRLDSRHPLAHDLVRVEHLRFPSRGASHSPYHWRPAQARFWAFAAARQAGAVAGTPDLTQAGGFLIGRFERRRRKARQDGYFRAHRVVHNGRHTERILLSKQDVRALVVVDVSTSRSRLIPGTRDSLESSAGRGNADQAAGAQQPPRSRLTHPLVKPKARAPVPGSPSTHACMKVPGIPRADFYRSSLGGRGSRGRR